MDRKLNEQVGEHGNVCQRKEATAALHKKSHRDCGKHEKQHESADDVTT